MPRCKRPLFLAALLTVLYAAGACAQPAAPVRINAPPAKTETGIAVTPRNFPSHTDKDVDEAFRLAAELADYAVFIYQWHELNMHVVRSMIEKAKKFGLNPIVGLSPTSLDQGRKELDLPADIRRKAGSPVSFANPVIRTAFVKSAEELATLQPPYLCLATEINFLAMQRLPEYLYFASLYQEAYAAVKRISPATKVLVSFQWEWMRILDAREPDRIKEHSKLIDIFRPRLDAVGFTTYPAPFHVSPSELPPDYYAWMYHHIQDTDEVLLMEVGWPTQGSGSELEQQAFIQALPRLLSGVKVSVIAWALLHDVSLSEFDANLNTVGLITSRGRKKPGYADFKNLHDSAKSEVQ
jgi:hypothetical protein